MLAITLSGCLPISTSSLRRRCFITKERIPLSDHTWLSCRRRWDAADSTVCAQNGGTLSFPIGKSMFQQSKQNRYETKHSKMTDYSPGIVRRSLRQDRKSTRLNSSRRTISYAVFCLKKKN